MRTSFLIARTSIIIENYDDFEFEVFEQEINNETIPVLQINEQNVNTISEQTLSIDNLYYDNIYADHSVEVKFYDIVENVTVSILKLNSPYENAILDLLFDNIYINSYLVNTNFFNYFAIRLLFTPGINLHASAIKWQDKGILFSAPSGTGKSTQANLWCQLESAEIINGDQPAITVVDNIVEAHGTPWSGSEPIITNISVPVICIVVLEQALENEITLLTKEEAVISLFPRFLIPNYNAEITSKAVEVIDQIINLVPIYKLKCRPDYGAVEILKNELSLLEE